MRFGLTAALIGVFLVGTIIACKGTESEESNSEATGAKKAALSKDKCKPAVDHLIALTAKQRGIDPIAQGEGEAPELIETAQIELEDRREVLYDGCQSGGTPEDLECILKCQDLDCVKETCSVELNEDLEPVPGEEEPEPPLDEEEPNPPLGEGL